VYCTRIGIWLDYVTCAVVRQTFPRAQKTIKSGGLDKFRSSLVALYDYIPWIMLKWDPRRRAMLRPPFLFRMSYVFRNENKNDNF
jgi:hypothetical protein